MRRKNNRPQKRLIGVSIIILAGILLVWGLWAAFHRQDLPSWIREQSAPIEQAINKGGLAFDRGDYAAAEVFFSQAITMSRAAQAEGRLLLQKSMDQFAPPRKFIDKKQVEEARKRGQIMSFQILEAKASHGMAQSLWAQIQQKYQAEFDRAAASVAYHFSPPAEEVTPIYKVIDSGLKANTEENELRILRAQISGIMGQFKLAERTLQEAIRIDSQSAEAYNALGMLYTTSPVFMNLGGSEAYRQKAVDAFEDAVRVGEQRNKPLAAPYFNLGLYYATPDISKDITAQPDPADRMRAIEYLQKFIALSDKQPAPLPGHQEAIASLRFLGVAMDE